MLAGKARARNTEHKDQAPCAFGADCASRKGPLRNRGQRQRLHGLQALIVLAGEVRACNTEHKNRAACASGADCASGKGPLRNRGQRQRLHGLQTLIVLAGEARARNTEHKDRAACASGANCAGYIARGPKERARLTYNYTRTYGRPNELRTGVCIWPYYTALFVMQGRRNGGGGGHTPKIPCANLICRRRTFMRVRADDGAPPSSHVVYTTGHRNQFSTTSRVS